MHRIIHGQAPNAKYRNGQWVQCNHPLHQWKGYVLGSQNIEDDLIEYEVDGGPPVVPESLVPLLLWEHEIVPA